MSKLYSILLTACLAISFAACSDDDCEALHLNDLAHYPNVLKGTFPTEDIVLNLGETLTITPELLHPEGAFYSWMINGEEVFKEQTFTYKIEKPCRADLSCVISNQYGKVEMNVRFSSKHDFSKGFFYLIANTVNFYDTEKGINYEDCYGSLNNGKKLNVDNPNAFSQDGKFYVLSNSNATNQDHLYVINAQTLFMKNRLSCPRICMGWSR